MYSRTFKRLSALFLFVSVVGFSAPANATSFLFFESSPESWVGQGQTLFATPDDGYEFTAAPNYDNGVNFSVIYPGYSNWWYLNISAPFDQPLSVGLYENATRWPFQSPDAPGLSFYGNGRGNNRNLGFFEVLEANYDPLGTVQSFAVNFTQYGEENLNKWINGQLRFNSSVPLTTPEPRTFMLMIDGLFGLMIWFRYGYKA